MFSNYNHFIPKGYGYSEDDDDNMESLQESEQSSQSSRFSEEMESSKGEEEEINPRSRIREENCNHHQPELEALINEYEQNGDSTEVAHIKAVNALLPVYRKELRKVLLEYLQWIRMMKNDSVIRKVMDKISKTLKGYDWLEPTELAIDKQKLSLNRLFVKLTVPKDYY